jgi:hypothetical protein
VSNEASLRNHCGQSVSAGSCSPKTFARSYERTNDRALTIIEPQASGVVRCIQPQKLADVVTQPTGWRRLEPRIARMGADKTETRCQALGVWTCRFCAFLLIRVIREIRG